MDLRAHDPAADDLDRLARAGPERVVRAEVIRTLLLGAGETEPGCAPGVRLRGARISGRLDLMGASVTRPLVCEFCSFDDELRFVESSTKTVRIVSSRLPGFNGTRMHLGRRPDRRGRGVPRGRVRRRGRDPDDGSPA
ncbi:MAG TPA: hypothetical protein VHY31_01985 [Streptosporangiaceae bacterium]|nr:hypothetical protein [Streptosporangiaceae bacterium]